MPKQRGGKCLFHNQQLLQTNIMESDKSHINPKPTCNRILLPPIEMIGSYYCLSSVKLAMKSILNTTVKIKPPQFWKKAWDRGVYIKTIKDNKSYYSKSGYSKNVLSIDQKITVLRLFYTWDMLNFNEEMFLPILVDDVTKKGGVSPNQNAMIIDSDHRRDILSFSMSILGEQEDKKYVIKISNRDEYKKAYEYEASIYEYLKEKTVKNIVEFYGSGVDNNKTTIMVDGYSIPKSDLNLRTESTNEYYIVLENTCDYYDFEDYVILINDEEKVKTSFVNTYNALINVSSQVGLFFHGDFHNNNVKVNKEGKVKLFDFDYSCIIDTNTKIISSNITNYCLKYDNKIIFTNEKIESFEIDNLFFNMFDVFRLWLSVSKTMKHALIPRTEPSTPLNKMITTFETWYNIITDDNTTNQNNIGWHEYFMGNYFYEAVYGIHQLGNTSNTPGFQSSVSNIKPISVTSQDLKTLSVSICDSVVVNNKDLEDLIIDFENCNVETSYVLITDKSLKSLSVGGGKRYKQYGKFVVNLNGKRSTRVVWTYRNQLFVKRKNGEYVKIKRHNIKLT